MELSRPRPLRRAALALSAVFLLPVAAACGNGGGGGGGNGVIPTSEPTQDPTPDPTATPTPTPTPDVTPDTSADPDGPRVQCQPTAPAPLESGTCVLGEGTGDVLLIKGTLLTPRVALQYGELLIEGDEILCSDCDCSGHPRYADARVLDCPTGIITPGFINAHEHMGFAVLAPRPTDQRFEHRHDWRRGIRGHDRLSTPQNPNGNGQNWSELRHVMGGATSIFGSGGRDGMLRNLDRNSEGLAGGSAEYDTFPLGDSGGALLTMGCDYPGFPSDNDLQSSAYVPHVAEGIDATARNEFLCLSGAMDGIDALADNISFIHSVGLLATDFALMAARGTSMVWSPRSNISLYGHTAQIPLAKSLGVRIGIGSDWIYSGSMNMLRELRCADEMNQIYFGGALSNADLIEMATLGGAATTGVEDQLGSLTAGRLSDITIFDGANAGDMPFRAVLDAGVPEVVLVLRAGLPLFGDAALLEGFGHGDGACESVDVCGRDKRLCVEREFGQTLAALTAALNAEPYELFSCEEPPMEPTCIPSRPGEFDGVPSATDGDADGIADAEDLCPTVFSPLRPLDEGLQPDSDGDGVGDVCDVCPFDADTTTCTGVDPNDLDGDGVGVDVDNCPNVANEDQADTDQDGQGDVCDACPEFANPGGGACPASVYAVKRGEVTEGTPVLLQGMVVTAAREGTGIFAQLPASDAAYDGPDFSGIFVFDRTGTAKPGDIVDIEGEVSDFFGQTQISDGQLTMRGSGDPPPAIEIDDISEIATGGSRAAQLEGMLVSIGTAAVSNADPEPGPGDMRPTGEFEIEGGLRVDDYFYALEPLPVVEEVFLGITGILRFANQHSKLNPRDGDDVIAGDARLRTVDPGPYFQFAEASGSALPPLMATLIRPTGTDTEITVTSSDEAVATIVDGPTLTIPAGEAGVEIQLAGVAAAEAPVTIRIELDGEAQTVPLTVLPADHVPSPSALVADADRGVIESELSFTLELDAPVGNAGAMVTLSVDPAEAATFPNGATLSLNAGDRSASFTALLGTTEATATFTATVTGAAEPTSASTSVEIVTVPPLGLLIVELYYDSPGGDDGLEWVRLYNGDTETIDLSGYSFGAGGNSITSATYQLSGSVAPGECVLIGGPMSNADNGMPEYDVSLDFTPDLQNSGANADGLGLFAQPASALNDSSRPIDVVIYGESNANGLIGPDGEVAPVDVGDAPSGQSLLRTSSTSWIINETPTPNTCTPILE